MSASPYPLPSKGLHDAVVERFIEAALEAEQQFGIGATLNAPAIAEHSWLSRYDKAEFKEAFNNTWPTKAVPIKGTLRLLRAIGWAQSDDDDRFVLTDSARAWLTLEANARHQTLALALAHAWFAQYTHLSEAEFIATVDTLLVNANISGADIPDGGALSAYRLMMYYGVASESSAETQRVEAVSEEPEPMYAPELAPVDDVYTTPDAEPLALDEVTFEEAPAIEQQDTVAVMQDTDAVTVFEPQNERLSQLPIEAAPLPEPLPTSLSDDQPVQPFVAPPPAEDTANILSDFGTQKKTAAFDRRPTGRTRRVTVNAGETSNSIPSSDEGAPEFKRGERQLLDSADAQVEKSSESDTRKVRRNPFNRLNAKDQTQPAEDNTLNDSGTTWSRHSKDSDTNSESSKWGKGNLDRYRRSGDDASPNTGRVSGDRLPVDNRVYGPRGRPTQNNTPNPPQTTPSTGLTLTLPDGSQVIVSQALIDEIKAENGISTLEAIALLQSRFMKQSGQTDASLNDETE